MTPEQAYDQLLAARPVIARVLWREKPRCDSAAHLARCVGNSNDPRELLELIELAAQHVWSDAANESEMK